MVLIGDAPKVHSGFFSGLEDGWQRFAQVQVEFSAFFRKQNGSLRGFLDQFFLFQISQMLKEVVVSHVCGLSPNACAKLRLIVEEQELQNFKSDLNGAFPHSSHLKIHQAFDKDTWFKGEYIMHVREWLFYFAFLFRFAICCSEQSIAPLFIGPCIACSRIGLHLSACTYPL